MTFITDVKEITKMTNTDILLEDLEDVLDDATSIPLSKKSAVDVDKIRTIIEDIRLNTPQETKQAKAIVDSRNTILEEAKKAGEEIIAKAEADARELVAKDAITQQAQAQAAQIIAKATEEGNQILENANKEATDTLNAATARANEITTKAQNTKREIENQFNAYADDMLLSLDDTLYNTLVKVRGIREGIQSKQNNE